MSSTGWLHFGALLLLAVCGIIFVFRSKLLGRKPDPAGNEFYSGGQQDVGHGAYSSDGGHGGD
jgi:hypothetical protein